MSSLKRSVVALEMDVASVKEKQKLPERTIMEIEKKLRIHESGGGYSTDAWVGRCGPGVQTLTLFKTIL